MKYEETNIITLRTRILDQSQYIPTGNHQAEMFIDSCLLMLLFFNIFRSARIELGSKFELEFFYIFNISIIARGNVMSFHRLLNILLLLALIPTIAVSSMLTYHPNSTNVVTGFTGIVVDGRTYDGFFVEAPPGGMIGIGPSGFPFLGNLTPVFGNVTPHEVFRNELLGLVRNLPQATQFGQPGMSRDHFLIPFAGNLIDPAAIVPGDRFEFNSTSSQWTTAGPIGIKTTNPGMFPITFDVGPALAPSPVPEPSSLVLILCCIGALVVGRKRFAGNDKELPAVS